MPMLHPLIQAITCRVGSHFKDLLGLTVLALGLAGCDVSNEANNTQRQQDEDPVVVDYPLAFVSRSLPIDEEGIVREQNILDPAAFFPGAKLIIKDRAKSSALEKIITEDLFPKVNIDPEDPTSELTPALIDIKDLEPSHDGTKLLFALRAPADPNAGDDEQPTWNIWEYNLEEDTLTQLIKPTQAELGHDVSPHYLPDGRIVFTSTRQKRTKAILLDEEKAQYAGQDEDLTADAFNLHIYDPLTENINQISFNPSHDLQPSVLSDGRIVFLRWDNMLNHDSLSFYTVHPDGSNVQKLYGLNGQTTDDTGATFWEAREITDGQLLVNLRARQSNNWGGDIITIDTAHFIDLDTPNPQNPGVGSTQASLAPLLVNIDESDPKPLSMGGFYNSAFALNDGTGRYITSWSPCRLFSADEDKIYPCEETFRNKPDIVTAPPNFGLWVLNNRAGTMQPLKPATEDEMYTEVVVFFPKMLATSPSSEIDNALKSEGVGIINIRNVYDMDGMLPADLSPNPADVEPSMRPARFIRIVKNVAIPSDEVLDFDRSAFGVNRTHLMRDIVGYVPVEADGSAKFKVPANIPVMLNLVDATGKRLNNTLFGDARHENWLSVQAGETFECTGCHDASREEPSGHGRRDAEASTGFTAVGETLAETFDTTYGQVRTPTIDVLFQDIWSPPESLEKEIVLAYELIAPTSADNLPPFFDNNCLPTDGSADTKEPVSWQKPTQCASSTNPSAFAKPQWNSLCRITIHYDAHIQPLWERDRRQCSPGATDMDPKTLIADYTCTRCHSADYKNADGMPLLTASSLFLTREMPTVVVPPEADTGAVTEDNNCNQNLSMDFVASYRQLLNPRLALTLNEADGSLSPIYTSMQQDTVDDEGELVLNDDGSIRQTVVRTCRRESNPMRGGSATASRFFELFTGDDVIHSGIMSASELRLIAEWLDIGAQYYNNPFDAPLDN
ncbi:HzsA-related protein [Marinagarivorans algicola]|uniref:HzsA-related protein n=1 Tax=Marinagarivorans algicola TaxID=1513270 RepID=UPI003735124D